MDSKFNKHKQIKSNQYRKHFENYLTTYRILKQIRRLIYEELLDIDENDELIKDIDSLTRVIHMVKPKYLAIRNEYRFYQVCRDMRFMFGDAEKQPNDEHHKTWIEMYSEIDSN